MPFSEDGGRVMPFSETGRAPISKADEGWTMPFLAVAGDGRDARDGQAQRGAAEPLSYH